MHRKRQAMLISAKAAKGGSMGRCVFGCGGAVWSAVVDHTVLFLLEEETQLDTAGLNQKWCFFFFFFCSSVSFLLLILPRRRRWGFDRQRSGAACWTQVLDKVGSNNGTMQSLHLSCQKPASQIGGVNKPFVQTATLRTFSFCLFTEWKSSPQDETLFPSLFRCCLFWVWVLN